MGYVVHIQMKAAKTQEETKKLRRSLRQLIDNGFKVRVANEATGDYKAIESDIDILKSTSPSASKKRFFDCAFNSTDGFPSQKLLQTLEKDEKVFYFDVKRGEITSLF